MRRGGGGGNDDKAGSPRQTYSAADLEIGSPAMKNRAERDKESGASKGRGETVRIIIVMFVVVLLFNAGNLLGVGQYILHEEDREHAELVDLRRTEERDHQEVSQLETTVEVLKAELARLKEELRKHEEKEDVEDETELKHERDMERILEERIAQKVEEEMEEELQNKFKQLRGGQGRLVGSQYRGTAHRRDADIAPKAIQGVLPAQSAHCEEDCADIETDCSFRARMGACATDPAVMGSSCRLTCGLCRPCQGTIRDYPKPVSKPPGQWSVGGWMTVQVKPGTFYVYNETASGEECAKRELCYHAEAWVARHLTERGLYRVKRWAQAEFIWTFATEYAYNLTFLKASQMVNHVGGVFDELADKSKLYATLQKYAQRAGCTSANTPQVVPFSVDARNATECAALLHSLQNEPSHAWLLKPKGGSGGMGIQLLKSNHELWTALVESHPPAWEATDQRHRCQPISTGDPDVVQAYIDNPLLLNGTKQRKFNLRAYLLISSVKPFLVFMHGDGYAGSSMHPYDVNGTDLSVHLTGMHTQAHESNYNGEERVFTWDTLSTMIETEFGEEMQMVTQGAPVRDWLRRQLKRRLLWLLYASREGLVDKAGSFNVLAVDLLLDSSFHFWVLEVNAYPWLAWETNWGKRWMHGLVTEMLDIQLEIWDAKKSGRPLSNLKSPTGWEVLANEDADEALYKYNTCPDNL